MYEKDAVLLVEGVTFVLVVIAGLYLLALGTASLVAPARTSRFLLGFAGSQSLHYFEIFLRIVAGAAFVYQAPRMSFSSAFSLFGWVLLCTTVGLLVVPWRWHYRFAQKTVPQVTKYIALLGLSSLAIGGFVLVAVFGGAAG